MSRSPAAPPPGGPSSRGPSFTLDVGDDLLAEALAAVESRARSPRRPPAPAERAAAEEALTADLSVDDSELFADEDALDPPSDAGPGPSLPRIPGWAEDPGEVHSANEADTFALDGPGLAGLRANPTWTDGERSRPAIDAPARRRAPDPDDDVLALWQDEAAPPGGPDDPAEARAAAEAAEAEAELIEALSEEVRALRRAEGLATSALQAALEREQALALDAQAAQQLAEAARAEMEAELSRTRAAAQRLVREKRSGEEAAARLQARLSRAEDGKAAAERGLLERDRDLAQKTEQITRLERDLERAHERRKRELEEQRRRDASRPLKELLPVLDNIQLAVQHAQGEQGPVVSGLRMIADQLGRTLKKMGMEPISAEVGSPFNPEQHEALQRAETDAVPEGSIAAELQPGYTFEGRLLRAARVSVAVAPKVAPAAPPPGAAAAHADATEPPAPAGDEAPEAGLDAPALEVAEAVLDVDTADLPAVLDVAPPPLAPPPVALRGLPARSTLIPADDDETQVTDDEPSGA